MIFPAPTISRLVPVLRHIRQVVPNEGPNNIGGDTGVAIFLTGQLGHSSHARGTYNQPLAKVDHGGGSQSRAIPLRPSPRPGKGRLVDIELGFTQSTRRQVSRGVANALDDGLRGNVVLDGGEEVGVSIPEEIDQGLDDEARVTGPGVEV